MLERAATDPYLWGALGLRVILAIVWDSPLADGYHVSDSLFANSEELYLTAVSVPEVYLLSWLTAFLTGTGTTIVPWLSVSLWTVVFGVLYGLRLVVGVDGSLPWIKTLQDVVNRPATGLVRASGYLLTGMWAILLTVALVTATHPDVETVRLLYEYHVGFAFRIAEQYFQAVFGLTGLFSNRHVQKLVEIVVNNGRLALRAMILGGAGGLALGIGIPLVMIIATNAAMIVGIFIGVVVRNNIVIGNGAFIPPLAYLAGFGAMHTFVEYVAFVFAGAGVGFLVYGLVRREGDRATRGGLFAVSGVVALVVAGLLEVSLSGLLLRPLKGNLTVDLQLLAVDLNANWAIGTVSMLLATAAMAVLLAFMTRGAVKITEPLIQ
jgi:hypothetical protein